MLWRIDPPRRHRGAARRGAARCDTVLSNVISSRDCVSHHRHVSVMASVFVAHASSMSNNFQIFIERRGTRKKNRYAIAQRRGDEAESSCDTGEII